MKRVILLLAFVMLLCDYSSAQLSPTVTKAKYFRKTIPLKDMEAIPPQTRSREWKNQIIRNEMNIKTVQYNAESALPIGKDPVRQSMQGKTFNSREPLVNVDGIGNVNGVFPPDTDGDVGTNHYFQMINLSFGIWDKDGNQLYGPVDNSALWAGFIGPWTGTNDGDPIVLYDEEADRWIATQFAINTSNGTYWELIAISETPDPLGSYYQYAFEFPTFNDYPKFGVWNDGYYASFNMFGDYNRAACAAYERDKMLIGDSTAQMVLFDLPAGSDPFSMLPADFDGTPPTSGTPNYFMYFNDDAWGYSQDQLRIWEFAVDWATPSNSTFQEVAILATDPFDSQLCNAPRWRCIDQPNTSTKLESLSDRLMFRLQYRNFGSYSVMMANHTVDSDGNGLGGVRWYELRDNHDGNGWFIYQQGTYAPDNHHRWMASVAMNVNGDIALGYTISSDSISPSVRYTGRTAEANLGELNIAEVELKKGFGAQGSYNRWGDYACMSVDPVDDSTFWFTEEYYGNGWNTRISAFNFDPVEPVSVNAGDNGVTCENAIFYTNGSAENFTSVLWTTSGDGIFGNPNGLESMYWRGTEDLENGEVTLSLSAWGFIPGDQQVDSMVLEFQLEPQLFAGNDTLICDDEVLMLSGMADAYDTVYWTTSGDGYFENDTALATTYYPAWGDISSGSVELSLHASGIGNCPEKTDKLVLSIDNCTRIKETDSGFKAFVKPNPSSGIFSLQVSDASSVATVTISNANGRIVYENTVKASHFTEQINLSTQPKGTYIIRIQDQNTLLVQKILIQ